jgi:hypothetical protein
MTRSATRASRLGIIELAAIEALSSTFLWPALSFGVQGPVCKAFCAEI